MDLGFSLNNINWSMTFYIALFLSAAEDSPSMFEALKLESNLE